MVGSKTITGYEKCTDTFNTYFISAVKELKIPVN